MAGAIFSANTTAEVTLAASSAKTLIRLISSTNSVIKIKEWGVYFDGISATAEPVLVMLCSVNTSNGEYTAHTPLRRSGPAVAARATVQTMNTSSQPTTIGVYAMREVHPQSGYQEKFAYGDEIVCANGSTALNGIIALICNSPTSVNVIGEIVFEE